MLGYLAGVTRKRPDHVAPSGPCPICGAKTEPGSAYRPFCSERGKWVDLGRWFKGDYYVPGETLERPPGMGGEPDDVP